MENIINILKSIKEEIEIQIKFNDLTTNKFNEIIDFVNKLEERINNLEEKMKKNETN